MTDESSNREQRRSVAHDEKREKVEAEQQERKLIADDTPQDVTNPRAKSRRHGKVTADKWNQ
jgi:hypothetical protein